LTKPVPLSVQEVLLRLAKYLAQVGVASRRQAELLIAAGKVKLNGSVITELGTQIDPTADRVEFEGRVWSAPDQVYILLNKPCGYICSVQDPQGRPTVLDLVRDIKVRLYPVGRLDFQTEGLLLLTNDGNFANLMIHPRYKIEKKYQAKVKGMITEQALLSLRTGIVLRMGSPCRPGWNLWRGIRGAQ
jgi:16S rRNA U516 pseudouridylate synthase RsuA-like enzyme